MAAVLNEAAKQKYFFDVTSFKFRKLINTQYFLRRAERRKRRVRHSRVQIIPYKIRSQGDVTRQFFIKFSPIKEGLARRVFSGY